MAIAFISAAAGRSASGAGTASASAVDSTGATLGICMTAGRRTGTVTVTDGPGNTWTGLTVRDGTDGFGQLFYVLNPTTSASHVVSMNNNNARAALAVAFYSGTATASAIDQEAGSVNGGATFQPGSLTPTEDNEIVVQGAAGYFTTSSSINSGYTIRAKIEYVGGISFMAGIADLIQTTATATNPTWDTGDTGTRMQACAASVKAAAAAAGQPTMRRWGGIPGMNPSRGMGRMWGRTQDSLIYSRRYQ